MYLDDKLSSTFQAPAFVVYFIILIGLVAQKAEIYFVFELSKQDDAT